MSIPTPSAFKVVAYLLLSGFIFFTSCEPATTTPPEEEEMEELGQMSPPPSDEAVRQFFHAWMADCANDHYKKYDKGNKDQALVYLRDLAKLRIDSALNDPAISSSAIIGQETRAWGPAIAINYESSISDYYYILKNLMYCTHTTIDGINHYSVGIAGTNAISQYDWLTEDINPATTTDTTLTGGKISKGAEIGLNVLKSLTDSTLQQTLVAFLQEKISNDASAVISVAGHSLGGALTQVYASFLKKQLGDAANVSAWVYAGPTAGDETFATNLVAKLGADNYHSYNNALDVVPHAWQVDSLDNVCSIYQGQSYCKWGMGENVLINLVVEYLKKRSQSGNYTVPVGQNHEFNSTIKPLNLVECAEFYSASLLASSYTTVDKVKVPGPLNQSLKQLNALCKVDSGKEEGVNLQLLMFLAKMGSEHTTGYTNYFFQAQDSAFRAAVTNYTAAPVNEETDNAEEGLDILNTFLSDVYDQVAESPSCKCN